MKLIGRLGKLVAAVFLAGMSHFRGDESTNERPSRPSMTEDVKVPAPTPAPGLEVDYEDRNRDPL